MDQTVDPMAQPVASMSRDLVMSAINEMPIRSAMIADAESSARGLPPFRTPAAVAHQRRTGQRVDPDRNTTITAGNIEGLNTRVGMLAAHKDGVGIARQLREQAYVAVTPGSAFGPPGQNHARMAFCVDDAVITAAFDRREACFGP